MIRRLGLLIAIGTVVVLVVSGSVVNGSGSGRVPAADDAADVERARASSTVPSAEVEPSRREIYKGYTLEEIQRDPKLLEEVRALVDRIPPNRVLIGPDGGPRPPIPDGSSDRACSGGLECR